MAHGSRLIAHLALCLIVAVCLLTGCREGGVAGDVRLLAIDSIVDTDSVAAWRQLQAIDSASLTTDADRHLYALLHQQILYKQYLPLDTAVLMRLNEYYTAHRNNAQHTRTLLLLGGAHEDAGRIAAAITWYKRAEAQIDTADYLNQAKVNRRLGLLYYNHFADHHIVKQKLERSAHYFELLGDSAELAVALDFLGSVYRTVDHPQAHATLERAGTLALAVGDTGTYVTSSEELARCLLNDSLPAEALSIIEECERHTVDRLTTIECCYTAAQALAALGRPAEAQAYLDKVPAPTNTYGRMMRTLCLKKIAEARGEHALAMRYSNEFDLYSDSLKNATEVSTIYDTERELDDSTVTTLRRGDMRWRRILTILGIVAGVLLVVVGIALYRNRAHRHRFAALKCELDSQKHLLEQLTAAEDTGDALLRQQHEFIVKFLKRYVNNLAELMKMHEHGNPLEFKHKFNELTVEFGQDELFWEGLNRFVNTQTNGLLDKLADDHPSLSTSDKKMLALMFAGFGSAEVASFLERSPQGMSTYRKRIAMKLELDEPLIDFINRQMSAST